MVKTFLKVRITMETKTETKVARLIYISLNILSYLSLLDFFVCFGFGFVLLLFIFYFGEFLLFFVFVFVFVSVTMGFKFRPSCLQSRSSTT
jgi:hypothetical protein